MKVRITLLEEMLGTLPSSDEVHAEYIMSKAPDAKNITDEIELHGVEDVINKGKTIFFKHEGKPVMLDYQIKGFVKDVANALREIPGSSIEKNKKMTKWTYKRTVDNLIFVNPRVIKINFDGKMGECQRPLRCETMRGERISLANSETVPAGSTMEFEVISLDPSLNKYIVEAMDYGKYKGLGGWRNSGKGRFEWEEIK